MAVPSSDCCHRNNLCLVQPYRNAAHQRHTNGRNRKQGRQYTTDFHQRIRTFWQNLWTGFNRKSVIPETTFHRSKINIFFWKVMARTMAFLLSWFSLSSTIPNLLHAFSIHLMNCYFPDFWYSHVTEKRTSEGRNAICEKSRTSCGSKVHFGNRWRNGWLSIWIVTTLFFIDGHTKIRI